jgi:hypothetical protein
MEITPNSPPTDITIDTASVDIITRTHVPSIVESTDLEVSIAKREFNIVGDNVYIGSSADTAPQWLQNVLDNAVAAAMYQSKAEYDSLLAELQVAKNAYYEQVNINATINSIIASHLTTLNASVGANSGNIVSLDAIKTSAAEVAAITIDILNASLLDGAINAKVGLVNTAIVNETLARASAINAVVATFNDTTAIIDTQLTTLATTDLALASSVTDIAASVLDTEARIIQSYTVYVDSNLSYDIKVYSSNGSMFKNGIINTTLTAKVYKGKDEITSTVPAASFSWSRVSNDPLTDSTWNLTKVGVGSVLPITTSDVFVKAVFSCLITFN